MTFLLSEVRTILRRRLEDTSGTPLWSDQLLTDALRNALDQYSQWQRQELTATVTLADAATSFALPAGARTVVAVIDPAGYRIPPATAGNRRTSDVEAAWSVFGSTVSLTRGVTGGTYTVLYTADWTLPATESGAMPTPDGDTGLLVAIAAVYALEVQATADWKRGPLPGGARYQQGLEEARAMAKAEWDARRRRVRVSAVMSDA